MTNKQIMAQVLEAVQSQFNVQARANLEVFGKDVSININVANIPNEIKLKITKYTRDMNYVLSIEVNTYITPSYIERVYAKCAENGARIVSKRNTSTMLDEPGYMNIDIQEALEQLWEEDNAITPSIVIVPTYKGRAELQIS